MSKVRTSKKRVAYAATMTGQIIREQFGVDYLLHKKREPMIQLPEHVVKELLEALDEAIDTFGKSCEDCDLNGEFSFSRGRLYSIKNVIENTAKEIKQ